MNVGVVRVLLHETTAYRRASYVYVPHTTGADELMLQLPASCVLAWAVQQFSDRRAHAQLSSVYLPSTARVGHVISEPRLPPARLSPIYFRWEEEAWGRG